jgi:hypothetical protein
MRVRSLVFAGAVVVATACMPWTGAGADPLRGAWRVRSMHLITAERDTIEMKVNESLVVFADGYYSISYCFGKDRPATYAERWRPSDEEKLARFGRLIVNSGSYRLAGGVIDATPLFALAPEFVDGRAVFSYRFVKDVLELTWERSIAYDGLDYPSAGTVTLLRLTRIRGPRTLTRGAS